MTCACIILEELILCYMSKYYTLLMEICKLITTWQFWDREFTDITKKAVVGSGGVSHKLYFYLMGYIIFKHSKESFLNVEFRNYMSWFVWFNFRWVMVGSGILLSSDKWVWLHVQETLDRFNYGLKFKALWGAHMVD